MSIIDLQESLKDVSDDGLMKAFRSGSAPQFLVLGELQRRKRMRDDFKRREAADTPTVAEEIITGAGVPQEGLIAMAGAMAPKTNVAQDTGLTQAMPMQPTRAPQPQMAASGGLMSFASGGAITVQPTGGGNYILVQDGERVQGTGVYSDFESADAASRAIRDAQPFQVPRILADKGLAPSPIAMDEGPSLQEIDPDSTAFVAPEVVSEPSLNMDTAGGLGRMFFDERIPKVPSDQPSLEEQLADRLGFAVDADKLARLSEIDTPPPSVLAAPQVTGVGQQNNPNIDGPLSSALQYYGGTAFKGAATPEPTDEERRIIEGMSAVPEAGAKIQDSEQGASTLSGDNFSNDPTKGYSYPTDVPTDDPSMEGRAVFKKLAEVQGGGLPKDIYGGYDDPEAIARRQQRERMLELEPLGEGMQKDVATTIAEAAEQKALEEQGSKTAEAALAAQEESFNQPDPLKFIDSVTDGGADGAGFGSYDSEIAKYLSDRRKRADQNKWLALAEAGFAMMGPAATFGQGIAKGGQAGLKALRESQKDLDAFETDMLKLQASLDIADARNQTTIKAAQIRGDNALAAAMLRKKDPAITASALTAAQARVNEARDVLANAVTQADKVAADAALQEALAIRDEFTRIYSGQIGANTAFNTAGATGGIKDVDLTTQDV